VERSPNAIVVDFHMMAFALTTGNHLRSLRIRINAVALSGLSSDASNHHHPCNPVVATSCID